jgi:hypothetical protein
MRQMLSKSRLNRRLHAIPEGLWPGLFALLAESAKRLNPDQQYVVDSLPVPACENIRTSRCRLYRDEAFRGYIASKRRYFYGLRLHVVVTAQGIPVEFTLTPRPSPTSPPSKRCRWTCRNKPPSMPTARTTITYSKTCWPRPTATWWPSGVKIRSGPIRRG